MTRLSKILIALAAVTIATGSNAVALDAAEETNQTRVTVTMIRDECDFFIVETAGGFCIFEWSGGSMPVEGDTLRGDLDSYGFQNAYNVTQKSETTAYVEEYWLSWDEAIEKLSKACE